MAKGRKRFEGTLKAGDPGVIAYSEGFVIPVCFASGCFPAKLDTGSSRGIVVPEEIVAKIAGGPARLIGEDLGVPVVVDGEAPARRPSTALVGVA